MIFGHSDAAPDMSMAAYRLRNSGDVQTRD